jgi:hypothetical protein
VLLCSRSILRGSMVFRTSSPGYGGALTIRPRTLGDEEGLGEFLGRSFIVLSSCSRTARGEFDMGAGLFSDRRQVARI